MLGGKLGSNVPGFEIRQPDIRTWVLSRWHENTQALFSKALQK